MFNSSSDPFVQALKSIHYLVVRLPRADLAPLQILTRASGSLMPVGDLVNVFVAGGAALPPIRSGVPVASINGSRSGRLKIGLGLSLLGNIIGAMGGSKLGFDAAYSRAETATFAFENVAEDSVGIDLLDLFLSAADVNPGSSALGRLIEANEVYAITGVLKSDTFVFEVSTSSSGSLSVDVPVIQSAVGANVAVKPESASGVKIAYTGKTPLAFAFKAIRLYFDDGRFTSFKPAENVALSIAPSPSPDPYGADYLASGSAFAPLS